MMKNNNKVFAMYTDWNREGAEGSYGGVGWYRIINPLEKIENVTVHGKFTVGGERRKEIAWEMKREGRIWFMKYIDDMIPIIHVVACKRLTGAKLVIDFDDDMFHVHPLNVAYKWHYPGSEKNEALKFLARNADALVVSTAPLAESLSFLGKPITVIPNCIDPKIWTRTSKKTLLRVKGHGEIIHIDPKAPKDKIRIGWVSSTNHLQDTPIIMKAMDTVLKKYPNVEFWVIGFPAEEFEVLGEQVKLILGTKGYKEFPAFMKSLNLDIAIAPLINDEFNRGKSNIKWMEAAMCGVPCVASKVYPYEHSIKHGETGYLAHNTEHWVYYLSKLVEDEKLRVEMGKKAKEYVLKHYNINDHLNKYVDFFKTL